MGVLVRKPEGTAGSALPAIAIGCFVAFGGVLYGYDTGTIGGIITMPYFINQFATNQHIVKGVETKYITQSQSSEIVSILSAGTFFGALSASPAGDMIGRRFGLMLSAVIFTFGVILQTASTAIPMFVAGRFFAGFGVGQLSALGELLERT